MTVPGSCTTAGANTDVNGQCTITFTSPTGGTVTGHATSTLSVAGSAPFTVQTDAVPPNSGDAVKVFQDAKIAITPNGTNRVGDPHTFTATVMVDLGNGQGFVLAPDGTPVTFTSLDSNGATSTPNPPAPCTTTGGSCTTTITSPTTGQTVVSAHVTFTTPEEVTLTFNEDVRQVPDGVRVYDADGHELASTARTRDEDLLVTIEDEYGMAFTVPSAYVSPRGYTATVDSDGWVRSLEDSDA